MLLFVFVCGCRRYLSLFVFTCCVLLFVWCLLGVVRCSSFVAYLLLLVDGCLLFVVVTRLVLFDVFRGLLFLGCSLFVVRCLLCVVVCWCVGLVGRCLCCCVFVVVVVVRCFFFVFFFCFVFFPLVSVGVCCCLLCVVD